LTDDTIRALVVAIRLSRMVVNGTPEPRLGRFAKRLVDHIAALPPALADLFPTSLGGTGPGGGRTLWDFAFQSATVLDQINRDAQGSSPLSFGELDGVEQSLVVFRDLQARFTAGIDVADRSDQEQRSAGMTVEIGYDAKLWLTCLSAFPDTLDCQLWLLNDFNGVPTGGNPPPASNVTAVLPSQAVPILTKATIVASRRGATLVGPLNTAAIAGDRVGGVVDCDYLLRRTDASGIVDARWGNAGYAWIAQEDLRRILRWATATLPMSILGGLQPPTGA
jgi:hypothetical protein